MRGPSGWVAAPIAALSFIAGCAPSPQIVSADACTDGLYQRMMAIQDADSASLGASPAIGVLLHWTEGELRRSIGVAEGCAVLAEDGVQCEASFTLDTPMRVASMSKMATAFTALALVEEGLLDLDADLGVYDAPLARHPAHPDRPMTLRHLLSHTSGLRDPAVYWIAAPGRFEELVRDGANLFGEETQPPGTYFVYANINYTLIAWLVEAASGQRFDEAFNARVKPRAGDVPMGFNWSSVDNDTRAQAAHLYREDAGEWVVQLDDRTVADDGTPRLLAEDNLDLAAYLATYEPGTNPTLFSPQGGLRTSVRGLSDLNALIGPGGAFALAGDTQWRHDSTIDNGDTLGGVMPDYGLGTHGLDASLTGGVDYIGHTGDAYGLRGGSFIARDGTSGFTYVLTGTRENAAAGRLPGFLAAEEALIRGSIDTLVRCRDAG